MDLLGGYGSDDSSASDPGPLAMPPEQDPQGGDLSARPSTASTTETTKPEDEPSLHTNTRTSTSSRVRRKGTKLVSLHAILPQHIRDQLVLQTALSNDSSDEDNETHTTKPLPQKPMASKRHASVDTQDSGILSLLSDLHAAPTSTPFLTIHTDTSSNNNNTPTAKASTPSAPQPLGAAFTTAETVTIRRPAKGPDEQVTDIHGVDHRSTEQNTASSVRNPTTVQAAAPVTVPRPSARPVMAPPPISSSSSSLQPFNGAVETSQVPFVHQGTNTMSQAPAFVPTTTAAASRASKKRSRQDMRKALRSGNIAALDQHQDAGLQILETSQPVYQPQEETYQMDTSNVVKVAPVQMYDPSQGSDVMGASVTSKQRSKHQINQLLANAASLELQRARAMGRGGSSGNSKRAGAKRKYGW